MKTRSRFVLITLALTIVLMAFHPIGPFGAMLWPQGDPDVQPEPWQLPLFLVLFIAEAAVTAFGVAYLFLGWRFTRAMLADRPRLAMGVHASVAFLFIQWWPHGNLHMSVPFSFGAILAIDYAFHLPIMIASVTLLAGVVHVARRSLHANRSSDRSRAPAAAATHLREEA